ncbi:MAG: zinc-ribbon domain-containing protein [Asgard group archaeon]|nr:zinc-ribbon domain-containing protein [Asgard group archaeon]
MVEYRCPVCGKPVLPTFKFCKSCGARLPKEMFKKKQESKDIYSDSLPSDEKSESPEIEKIEPEIVQALAVKGRLLTIDKEMEEILEEIENLEERVKVGLIPKEDAKKRIKKLNQRFVEIRIDKKKLKKGTVSIPIFDIIKSKEQSEERLEKLEGLKKEKAISQKTYEKMKQEYKEAIAKASREITNEIVKMEHWKDQLKKELQQKREELERLFVRKSTGELSEEEYAEEKEELAEEIKNWEAAIEELKKTLRKLT